ncbi:MAG: hypothetical protein DBY37_14600 [Desulfovibrionaceae bacterium]|nr:MAG: hypothetical protein DBY37_14600 [Desulfovibrionaceae bacterium]
MKQAGERRFCLTCFSGRPRRNNFRMGGGASQNPGTAAALERMLLMASMPLKVYRLPYYSIILPLKVSSAGTLCSGIRRFHA